jgi:uncharacterized protein (DUF2141 family)
MGNILIELKGLKNTKGKVNIAIYNSVATFNKPTGAYRKISVDPSSTFVKIEIENIPAGTYAFGLFHDENENQKLDMNFFGIPKEGFAFSNNAMGTFGPPTFQQTKFVVPEDGTVTQTIVLKFF